MTKIDLNAFSKARDAARFEMEKRQHMAAVYDIQPGKEGKLSKAAARRVRESLEAGLTLTSEELQQIINEEFENVTKGK